MKVKDFIKLYQEDSFLKTIAGKITRSANEQPAQVQVKGLIGSLDAIIGAALGTVAGIFMGLIGVLFMPLVGAAVGEYIARKDHQNAMKVGVATWLGIMAGLIAKVVIAFMMIGIFIAALLI